MMTSLKVTLPVNSSQQPKEEPVKRQAQTTAVHRHNLTPAYNPRRRRPGVPLTAAAVPQATAAVATGTTCSRPSTVEPTAQSAEPSVTSLPSNNLPRRQPNLVKAPRWFANNICLSARPLCSPCHLSALLSLSLSLSLLLSLSFSLSLPSLRNKVFIERILYQLLFVYDCL